MFRFKQFTIHDGNTPMKVGVDSVLLGSWADASTSRNCLDIGAGSGILCLMLAQRFPVLKIEGIEINENAIKDAQLNIQSFPLKSDLKIFARDFLTFDFHHKYDFIISNPPYYSEDILSPDSGRKMARSQIILPLDLMLAKVKTLLSNKGKFTLIFDARKEKTIKNLCLQNDLFLARQLSIAHSPKHEFSRMLFEFSFQKQYPQTETLFLKDCNGDYTPEYQQLTKAFYLHF